MNIIDFGEDATQYRRRGDLPSTRVRRKRPLDKAVGLWPFAGGAVSSFHCQIGVFAVCYFRGSNGVSRRVQEMNSIDGGTGLDKLLGQFPMPAVCSDQCWRGN